MFTTGRRFHEFENNFLAPEWTRSVNETLDNFSRTLGRPLNRIPGDIPGVGRVKDTEAGRVLKTALPGVSVEDLTVSTRGNTVSWRVGPSADDVFAVQRTGSWDVPEEFDAENVSADLTDGVLTLFVPLTDSSDDAESTVDVSTGSPNAFLGENTGQEERGTGGEPAGSEE